MRDVQCPVTESMKLAARMIELWWLETNTVPGAFFDQLEVCFRPIARCLGGTAPTAWCKLQPIAPIGDTKDTKHQYHGGFYRNDKPMKRKYEMWMRGEVGKC
jgi:hypothetical protein